MDQIFYICPSFLCHMTTNLEGSQISEESTAVPYEANFFLLYSIFGNLLTYEYWVSICASDWS